MAHGYNIKNSFDFFRKLLDEREDFLRNPDSARYGINCAITAWQLHDWVYAEKEKFATLNNIKSIKDFRTSLYTASPYFRTIHDLADGAKHYELTSRQSTIFHTEVSSWKDVSSSSKTDSTPQLFLTIGDKGETLIMTFDDLLYVISFFWYELFHINMKGETELLFDNYTWF